MLYFSSKPDFRTALYSVSSRERIQKRLGIQNAAAMLLTPTAKSQH